MFLYQKKKTTPKKEQEKRETSLLLSKWKAETLVWNKHILWPSRKNKQIGAES